MPQPTQRARRAKLQPLTKLLRAGIQVAPFLSRSGRVVLLAISSDHTLYVAAEVTGLHGSRHFGHRADHCLSSCILEPCEQQGGQIPALNPGNMGGRTLQRRFLRRGVHPAPWWTFDPYDDRYESPALRPMYSLLAIDSRHRLVAEMVTSPEKVESARRELECLLDAFERDDNRNDVPDEAPPTAASDDDEEDDDDDAGEEWKRG